MKTQAPQLRHKHTFGLNKSQNQPKPSKRKSDGTSLIAIIILFAILAAMTYYYYF